MLLIRGLSINFVLVFFSSSPKFSCMCLTVIFTIFLCLKFQYSPWPKTPMNMSDTATAFSLCVLIPAFAMRATSIGRESNSGPASLESGRYDGAYQVIEGFAVLLPFLVTGLSVCVPMILFARRTELVVKTMTSAKRLRYLMMLISRCSTQELTNIFLKFTDHDHEVISRFIQLFVAELLHMQVSPQLFKQRLILDAEEMEIVDSSKMMRLIEKQCISKRRDDVDIFHDIFLVQYVIDQLILGYKERFGSEVFQPTKQQRYIFEKDKQKMSLEQQRAQKNTRKVPLTDVFTALDFNGDGVITKDEFVTRACIVAPLITPLEALHCFEAIDWDKSHCLNAEEFSMGFKGIALDSQDQSPAVQRELQAHRRVGMGWAKRSDPGSHLDMQRRIGRRPKAILSVARLQRWYRNKKERELNAQFRNNGQDSSEVDIDTGYPDHDFDATPRKPTDSVIPRQSVEV